MALPDPAPDPASFDLHPPTKMKKPTSTTARRERIRIDVPCHNRHVTWRLALVVLTACGAAAPTPSVEPTLPPPEVITTAPAVTAPIVARVDLEVPSAPTSLVVQGSTLFWSDGLGAIWSMPSDGSAPARQLGDALHAGFAFHLFAAGDQVFATSRKDLLRIGSDGGVHPLGVTGLADLPEESAGDARGLYLTVFKRTEVLRVPLTGGKPTKLADVSRGVLGLHGETLYVASYANGSLVAVPTRGGPAKTIASNLVRPTAVAADDTAVFVYGERDRAVRRIDLADGGVHVIARDLENSDDLVSDGAYVYTFTWGAQPGLVRIAKDGSHAAQRLTTDLKTPNKIAIDASAIYVSSRDQHRIVKLFKAALPHP